MRRAAKRDLAEPEIVDALEKVGAEVWRMHEPADLLVFFRDQWFVVEVKQKERKDQLKQNAFRKRTKVPLVKNSADALKAVGAIR